MTELGAKTVALNGTGKAPKGPFPARTEIGIKGIPFQSFGALLSGLQSHLDTKSRIGKPLTKSVAALGLTKLGNAIRPIDRDSQSAVELKLLKNDKFGSTIAFKHPALGSGLVRYSASDKKIVVELNDADKVELETLQAVLSAILNQLGLSQDAGNQSQTLQDIGDTPKRLSRTLDDNTAPGKLHPTLSAEEVAGKAELPLTSDASRVTKQVATQLQTGDVENSGLAARLINGRAKIIASESGTGKLTAENDGRSTAQKQSASKTATIGEPGQKTVSEHGSMQAKRVLQKSADLRASSKVAAEAGQEPRLIFEHRGSKSVNAGASVALRDVLPELTKKLSGQGLHVEEIVVRSSSGQFDEKNAVQTRLQTISRAQVSAAQAAANQPSIKILHVLEDVVRDLPASANEKISLLKQIKSLTAQMSNTGEPVELQLEVQNEKLAQQLKENLKPLLRKLTNDGPAMPAISVSMAGQSVKHAGAAHHTGETRNKAVNLAIQTDLNAPADESDTSGSDMQSEDKGANSKLFETTKKKEATSKSNGISELPHFHEVHKTVHVNGASGPHKLEIVNGKVVGVTKIPSSQLVETIEKIAELAKQQLSASNNRIEVQLDVKDVGKVMVDALHQMEKINLQIHVESADARRMLEGHLRPLVEQLAKEGLDIGKLDVSVRDQRQQEQSGQNLASFADHQRGQSQSRFEQGGQDRHTLSDSARSRASVHPEKPARSGDQLATQSMEIWA